jgi:alkylation response protein AidB-like acyl-CoA dehydrogenase
MAPTLRERARATELLRRIPDETIAELRAARLFRLLQPARYGGYRVKGRFGFASGCHHASWVLVFGLPLNAPEDGLVWCLVPRSDWEIDDNWNVMGLCGTGSCDLLIDGDVPAHGLRPTPWCKRLWPSRSPRSRRFRAGLWVSVLARRDELDWLWK